MLAVALFGVLAYAALPVSDLPSIDFPTLSVGAGLPGGDPETLASSIASPLRTKRACSPTSQPRCSAQFRQQNCASHASETPAKGRMHTCLDQYYALKDANALGGLKWIQKGGGFYSLCNAKLKG